MTKVLLDEPKFSLTATADGLVESLLRGSLARDDLKRFYDVLGGFLVAQPTKVMFLSDFSDLQEVSLAGRWLAATEARNNRPYIRKSAVVGWDSRWRVVGAAFFKASGRNDIELFESRDRAVSWLREP